MNELSALFQYQSDSVLLSLLCAIGLGAYCAFISKICFKSSKNMTITISMLPAVVAAALIAINGSLGTGVAILGVFGLVRFRSLPGRSTDIITVFYAMTAGLIVSTGLLVTAIAIVVLLGVFFYLMIKAIDKLFKETYTLTILAPEEEAGLEQFEDILKNFGIPFTFDGLKTSHMGSLFEYTFLIEPPRNFEPSKLLDAIRIHNGNLTVSCRRGSPELSL